METQQAEVLAMIVRAKHKNTIAKNSPYYRVGKNGSIIQVNPDGSPINILQMAIQQGVSDDQLIELAKYEIRRIEEWRAKEAKEQEEDQKQVE
jgi:hypothetical protein